MSCISRVSLCPASGDTENVLLQKILQSLNEGGSGSGGGVTGLSVDGGPFQTGQVSIVTGGGGGPFVLKAGDSMTGALLHPDGTSALPSISFSSDTDTGISLRAVGEIGFSAGGVLQAAIGGTQVLGTGADNPSAPAFSHVSQTNSGLYFDTASNLIGLSILGDAVALYTPGSFESIIGGVVQMSVVADQILGRGTTAALPTFSHIDENTTGMYVDVGTGGTLGFSVLGTPSAVFSNSALTPITLLAGGNVVLIQNATDLQQPLGIRFAVTDGVNARAGFDSLLIGTKTIANTSVTANTIVMLSRQAIVGTPGFLTWTLNAGVGFTVNSDNAGDDSVFYYFLIELAPALL